MRVVQKRRPPQTIPQTKGDAITNLETPPAARAAFNRIEKRIVRQQLAAEQDALCAFCMRRIDPTRLDDRGEPTMKIAHRMPIAVRPQSALDWANLFGSCDGGQRSEGRYRTCDLAQEDTALTVDPSDATHVARLRFERRAAVSGLFLTSDEPHLRGDVETTLALNSGELPELREAVWKAFQTLFLGGKPKNAFGKAAMRAYFREWRARSRLAPEMLGVIEKRIA